MRQGSLQKTRRSHLSRTGAVVLSAVFLLTGCTVAGSYEVLHALFDGVPAYPPAVLPEKPGTSASPGGKSLAFASLHRPYSEKKCTACHGDMLKTGPRPDPTRTCMKCHKGLGEEAWLHGPLVNADCSYCHLGHHSKHSHLLRTPSEDELCLGCHESHTLRLSSFHQKTHKTRCATCHDPHCSNRQADLFLRNSCRSCHPFEKHTRMHGPVAVGQCFECHTGETWQRPGHETCRTCHHDERFRSVPLHQQNQGKDCLACHDPHGEKEGCSGFLRPKPEKKGKE